MAKFRPNKGSLDKLKKQMADAIERRAKLLVNALAMWGDDAVGEVREEIRKVGAVDQGLLMGSVQRTSPTRDKTRAVITVFSPLEHASVVEFGRRPRRGGPPPLAPLVGWAKRKGIISALPTNPGNLKGLKGVLAKELQIVRAIAWSIFREGIAGRHPFTIAFTRKKKTIQKDVAALVELATP